MRKLSSILIGVVVVAFFVGLSVPVFADDDDSNSADLIASFNAAMDELVAECTSDLLDADSTRDMDKIAQKCESKVFKMLHKLEKALGSSPNYTPADICVYNEELDYTACFDPIHVTS